MRHMYWYAKYPHGMVNVDNNNIIDIDESAFKLEYTNWNHGREVWDLLCSDSGAYGAGDKFNFLIGICTDINARL